jgi:hypothetical protein
LTSSGRARIRCIITGTTASTLARCSAVALSTSSGSNFGRSTIVAAVGRLRMKWRKPHEWKSGAAIITVSRERRGIFESRVASALSPSGWPRWAPFGVPVVPEVRMM